jgi:hypothetical protein
MNTYRRHRFLSDIISYATLLYYPVLISATAISKTFWRTAVSLSAANRFLSGVSSLVLSIHGA